MAPISIQSGSSASSSVCDKSYYDELVTLVTEHVLAGTNCESRDVGPLEVNNFSICFWVEFIFQERRQGVYVKVPKYDLYLDKIRKVLPITEKDRSFARDEYESLKCLTESWNDCSPDVRFVLPLVYLNEYNAIVTKREYGNDIFRFFRKWDMGAQLGCQRFACQMRTELQRLATALSRFHSVWAASDSLLVDNILVKIKACCHDLKYVGVSGVFFEKLFNRLSQLEGRSFAVEMTKTLKGLDLRNIMLDNQGRLILLDPGAMKRDCREADLARFLVTLKLLYWGGPAFLIGLIPKPDCFETFIHAYQKKSPYSPSLLSLMIIKELLKQWRMARIGALSMKSWPIFVKRIVAIIYIDRFYKKQIKIEVTKLEEACGI